MIPPEVLWGPWAGTDTASASSFNPRSAGGHDAVFEPDFLSLTDIRRTPNPAREAGGQATAMLTAFKQLRDTKGGMKVRKTPT